MTLKKHNFFRSRQIISEKIDFFNFLVTVILFHIKDEWLWLLTETAVIGLLVGH